jgi:hypothetical protein
MCGQLQSQITNTRSSEIECANLLDPNTPPLLRIRYLDEKLKAIYTKIKHDEILEKHLENILIHMRQERILYNFQVQYHNIFHLHAHFNIWVDHEHMLCRPINCHNINYKTLYHLLRFLYP